MPRHASLGAFDRAFEKDLEKEPGAHVRVVRPHNINRAASLRSRLFYTCCESWSCCTCEVKP